MKKARLILAFMRIESVKVSLKALFLALLLGLSMAGCKPDRCKEVSCVQGTCVEGTCICATGYEGSQCDTLQTEKFIGSYQLKENCTAGQDTYAVQVLDLATNLVGLNLVGIWEQADTVQAYLLSAGMQFEIPRQIFGSFEISGMGTHATAGDSIFLEYYLFANGGSQPFDHCTAQMIKQ